jgi:hypothetical protein
MRHSTFLIARLLAVALVTACGAACGSFSDSDAGPPAGGDGGDGNVDGEGGVKPPEGCDDKADPKDSAPCVVSSFGVFVDGAGGSDTNDGTKEAPVKTFAGALAKVGNKPRIYVCEGTYAEHVVLKTAASIYGGFACGSWSYSAAKAKIAPADAGFALHVAGVSAPIVLADLDLVAQPGTKAAPSSVGAFVARSADVTMRRLAIPAGAGFGGSPGEAAKAAEPGTTASASIDGNAGTSALGGLENVCTCASGGTTTGGRGGDPAGTVNGANGAPAQVPPTGGTGAGQTRATCEAGGTPAQRGSDAPTSADKGSPELGTLDDKGWAPGDGEPGTNGLPGQGGGGGGSYTIGAPALFGGGGGGACGGCGGGGGGGGTGGGSSLAVLVLESGLKLDASILAATDAGSGGTGAAGAAGGPGAARGNGGGGACPGGNGGDGGRGGAGAGGSGGISAGILHKGAAPVVDGATEATITVGKPGDKGTGGVPQTNDGKPGDAKKVLAL